MKLRLSFVFNGRWGCSPGGQPKLIKNEPTGILRRGVEKLTRKRSISKNTMTLKIELIT